ncbi:hypothetical protein [Rhodococcus sp. NPDC003383]
MPSDEVKPQVEALAFMVVQRNVDLGGRPSLRSLSDLIGKYNKVRGLEGSNRVASSPARLSTLFSSAEDTRREDTVLRMLCETRDFLAADERSPSVPSKLTECIARMSPAGKAGDEYAGFWNDDTPVDHIMRIADDVEENGDSETAAAAHSEIALRMSRPNAPGGRSEAIDLALEHAKRGHALAMDIPEKVRTTGVKRSAASCARTAAWSLVQLYRSDVKTRVNRAELNERLKDLIHWKNNEFLAENLNGRPVAAALAKFHQTRAQALAEHDAQGEIMAFAEVVAVIIGRRSDDGSWPPDVYSQMWYHDMTAIITRLCALDWAWADDPERSPGYRRGFPEGTDKIVSELLDYYAADDEDARRAKKKAEAIFRLKKHTGELDKLYASDPVDLDGIKSLISAVEIDEFLYASEAAGLTAIGLSRYAIAVADLIKAKRISLPWLEPHSLLPTAKEICLRARNGTHDRTFGKFIQGRVDYYLHEIEQRQSVANDSAESEDEKRDEEEPLPENGGDCGPEQYSAAVKDLMDTLVVKTLIEAGAEEDWMQLKEAQVSIMNTAEAVSRYIGDLVAERLDDQERGA